MAIIEARRSFIGEENFTNSSTITVAWIRSVTVEFAVQGKETTKVKLVEFAD